MLFKTITPKHVNKVKKQEEEKSLKRIEIRTKNAQKESQARNRR